MEEHTGEVDVDGWWSEVERCLRLLLFGLLHLGRLRFRRWHHGYHQLADQPLFLTQEFTKVK